MEVRNSSLSMLYNIEVKVDVSMKLTRELKGYKESCHVSHTIFFKSFK